MIRFPSKVVAMWATKREKLPTPSALKANLHLRCHRWNWNNGRGPGSAKVCTAVIGGESSGRKEWINIEKRKKDNLW